MAARVPVSPLQELCLDLVVGKCLHFLSSHVTQCTDMAADAASEPIGCRVCLRMKAGLEESLVTSLRRRLFSALAEKSSGSACSCLLFRTLFSSQIKELAHFTNQHQKCVLEMIREHGAGLEIAKFESVRSELRDEFRRTMAHLPNLVVVTLPEQVTDHILAVLGKNCQKLRELYLGFRSRVTDSGVRKLCFTKGVPNGCCRTLQVVGGLIDKTPKPCVFQVYFESRLVPVTEDSVALLLAAARNVTALTSFNGMGDVMKALSEMDPGFKTKLRYLEDSYTNVDSLRLFSQMCPELEKIFLEFPQDGVLRHLHVLPNVVSVTLNSADCADIDEYLRRHGVFLRTLHVHKAEGLLHFGNIAKTCPNLQRLILSLSNLKVGESCQMKSLKSLELISETDCYLNLREILLSAPNLENLVIDYATSEEELVAIFCGDVTPLLRRLEITCCLNLTVDSVRWLIENMPRLLYLRLDPRNRNITKEEYLELREDIQKENRDLTLGPN